jgi:hypothetical protein
MLSFSRRTYLCPAPPDPTLHHPQSRFPDRQNYTPFPLFIRRWSTDACINNGCQ